MKNLIIIFFLSTAVLLLPASAQTKGEATDARVSEQETVKKLEREWFEAINARDRAAYERLLSKDFVSRGRTKGVINKENAIADLANDGGGESWSLKPKGGRVTVYAEDAAIASGRVTIKPSPESRVKASRYNYTHMYVKRDGGWKIVSENFDALDRPH